MTLYIYTHIGQVICPGRKSEIHADLEIFCLTLRPPRPSAPGPRHATPCTRCRCVRRPSNTPHHMPPVGRLCDEGLGCVLVPDIIGAVFTRVTTACSC